MTSAITWALRTRGRLEQFNWVSVRIEQLDPRRQGPRADAAAGGRIDMGQIDHPRVSSATQTSHDIVDGLEVLAVGNPPAQPQHGHYLIKPFDFGELLARLRSVIRRGRLPLTPAVLNFGNLRIDLRARQAFRRNHAIKLTSREFALLKFLALHAGEVVGRGAIAEHVWDTPFESMSNVIDVLIQRLRRKIDDPYGTSLITTRRGEGYMRAFATHASLDS